MELQVSYDYRSCIEGSEKVCWRLDDVFPLGTRLDFARPSLPESLAPTAGHGFLTPVERRTLNQITGHAYVNVFSSVEEVILATMVAHSQRLLTGDPVATRALARFADEEKKHQELFARCKDAFARDFGVACEVLDTAADMARLILAKSPMAVLLLALHIELMTQRHYTESVRDDRGVDLLFARLLKSHWLEEAQHARIDVLELRRLALVATPAQVMQAYDEYLGLLDAFSDLLGRQAEMDARSFVAKTGRALTPAEGAAVRALQHQGYRRTFLWMGMTHPVFVDVATRLDRRAAARVAEKAAAMG